jgi:hypothetical protein
MNIQAALVIRYGNVIKRRTMTVQAAFVISYENVIKRRTKEELHFVLIAGLGHIFFFFFFLCRTICMN